MIQFSSVAQLYLTLCDPMDCSTPGFPVLTVFWNLLKLISIELVMSSSHLILCHPLLLLPSIFSSIRVFFNESALCIRRPRIGTSASASVLSMNFRTDFFRIDWFDLLAVQGTLKSSPIPQFKSISSSALSFFMV